MIYSINNNEISEKPQTQIINHQLSIGLSEFDITPAYSLPLGGNFRPQERMSEGVNDPLMLQCMALSANEKLFALVSIDNLGLEADSIQPAIDKLVEDTSLEEENIIWAVSHTHSGPYCIRRSLQPDLVDENYLNELRNKFVMAVKNALSSLQPVNAYLSRTLVTGVSINRRIKLKNGKETNWWLLKDTSPQVCSSAGPVDPELLCLSFDDNSGKTIASIYNFAMHCTTGFGPKYSADYPGVVRMRLKQEFGKDFLSMYLPGASGDIANGRVSYAREEACLAMGNILADSILAGMKERQLLSNLTLPLDIISKKVDLPVRPTDPSEEWRINEWINEHAGDLIGKGFFDLKNSGLKTLPARLNVFRIDDVVFATLPGEAFVEYGHRLKLQSPFPWCIPLGYANARMGYLVTPQAWRNGGYESIPSLSSPISCEGSEIIVAALLEMLDEIYLKASESLELNFAE